MSKKASPTAIGIFIFIGLILGVGGLLLFSSSKFFTPTAKFIIYFENTLSGLNEGAPVKYRGVPIGSVSRVMIHFNQATNDDTMPVIIELQEDLIRKRLVGATIFRSVKDLGEEVRKGLRARLETESFVTGVLYVNLEVEQSPPPPVYHQLKPIYQEIPSRPTEIQHLMKSLAKLDLNTLVTNANTLLKSANQVVASPELTNAFTSLNEALKQYQLLGAKVNNRLDPLADSATNTLDQLNRTLVQARGAMQNFGALLAADSPLRNELAVALDQLAEASQSVSTLADYLHDHPNALLVGRKPASEKKP
jgi:paraquat-inducible protein B